MPPPPCVSSDSATCAGKLCPHCNSCFVDAMRKRANAASILIANHQLLFADIEERYLRAGYQATALLPPYSIIVFDEAHAIESATTSFFSSSLIPSCILSRFNHFVPDKNWMVDGILDILEEMTTDKDAAKRARVSAPSVRDALATFEQRLELAGTASLPTSTRLYLQAQVAYDELAAFCADMGAVFAGIKEENALAATSESRAILHKLNKDADSLKSFLLWDKVSKPAYKIARKPFQLMQSGSLTEVFYRQLYRESASIPMTMKSAVFDQFRSVVCILDAGRVKESFNDWMLRSEAAFVEKGHLIAGVYSSPAPPTGAPACTAKAPQATSARTAPFPHSSSAMPARSSTSAAKAQPAAPPRPLVPPSSAQAARTSPILHSTSATATSPSPSLYSEAHARSSDVAYLLSQKGPLSRILPNFKERSKQIELASNIAAAFNSGKVGMFEAGTGIGKSLAYLIPAVLWSLKHNKKVAVTTAKINLQQQLIQKDIPLVRQIIGCGFKAVLVKGRSNYLCLRRLDVALQEMSLFSDDDAAGELLDKIKSWAETTSDGSLADLPFPITDDIRSSVCSESESCLMKDCPHSSSCFFMAEREKADDALVLVANHHLLFADLKVRRSKEFYPKERASQEQPASDAYDSKAVLPPYKLIVFDEAHAMESSATSFFSDSTSRAGILRQINHFVPDKKRKIFTRLDALEGSTSNKSAAQRARSAIPDIRSELEKLEDAAIAACKKDSVLRLSRKTAFSQEAKNLLSQARTIQKMLSSFCASIRSALEGVSEKDKDDFVDSSAALQKLENAASLLEGFVTWSSASDSVFWIKTESRAPSLRGNKTNVAENESLRARFNRAPLSIAQTIKDTVFNRSHFHSVVCVSATLRVNNSFDFWMHQTGASLVERGRLIQGSYPSPFQYDKNVLLSLPTDIPFPNNDKKRFLWTIERLIPDLIRASSGSSLVLFTAKDDMRKCYDKACTLLATSGIRILCQDRDEQNRDKLLRSFRDDTKSVLFATKAFWEGVDAAGETLRHVIIVKLPFTPPDDPVFEARCERIDASGNSFKELSVPQAVIEFRQGFGRLIRQEKDRGVVTVLDSRIAQKDYGKTFLESIPKTQVARGSSQAVLSAIRAFFR